MKSQLYFQLLCPLTFLVLSMGFLFVYRCANRQVSARYFALSYFLGAVSFILDIFRFPALGFMDHLPSSLAYMLTVALFSIALTVHYGAKKPWLMQGTLVFLAMLTSSYFTFIDYDIVARIFTLNLFGSMFLFYPLAVLWNIKKRNIDSLIFGLLIVTVVQVQVRALIIILIEGNTLSPENYATSFASLAFQFTLVASALLIALALFIMYGIETVLDLRRNSETDSLTGLLNRRGIEAKLPDFDDALAKGVKSHGVLVVDIDHFKKINDTYGHLAGDRVLVACSMMLSSLQIGQSIVARMGGEEFNLILYNTNEETARLAADYICDAFAQLHHPEINNETVTVSIGVAIWNDKTSFGDALGEADDALYKAKSAGRNGVCTAYRYNSAFHIRGQDRRLA